MKFDWVRFLNENNIPYYTKAKNLKHGNIGLSCPLCAREGNPDPSAHLGIDPKSNKWNCWRNPKHGGNKPTKLVRALLGCSWERAKQIAEDVSPHLGDWEALSFDSEKLFAEKPKDAKPPEPLQLPGAFKPLDPHVRPAARFVAYLRGRGYPTHCLPKLNRRYRLLCCNSGAWKYRLIFPVFEGGQLMTWTSRTIYDRPGTIRYLTLPVEEEQAAKLGSPCAVKNIKECVWNYDYLRKGKVLIIMEGVFDAMKMDFFGKKYGLRATCIFGLKPSIRQNVLLRAIAKNFSVVYVMLDTVFDGMALADEISYVPNNRGAIKVPYNASDPGDLTPAQVKQWAKEWQST